jgi:hypothetical protein
MKGTAMSTTPDGAPQPVPATAHVSQPVRQARDQAQYVRQQKGHSLLLHLFIIGPLTMWIPAIYITASPNHFWHA